MTEPENVAPLDTRSDREKELEDKLGGRTLALALVVIVAIVQALIIVRLAY